MRQAAWKAVLEAAVEEGAVVLAGPGAPVELFPPGSVQRQTPPGALIPMAEGVRFAQPDRPVLAIGGDADVYGAGLGALLHAARRNVGITCLVADNGLAAATAGTAGVAQSPLRPLALAHAAGATFLAQAVGEGQWHHLTTRGLHHPGFGLINLWDRNYDLDQVVNLDEVAEYDPEDRQQALSQLEQPDRILCGVIHRNPDRLSLEATLLPSGSLPPEGRMPHGAQVGWTQYGIDSIRTEMI